MVLDMTSFIKNNIFTLVWAIIVFSYFIWGWYRDLRNISKLNKELKKFLEKIKKIKIELEDLENMYPEEKLKEEKEKYFNELLKSPHELVEGYKYIKEIGLRYFKALKRKNYKGVSSSSFFNEEDILLANFNINKITQRASIYVGSGLLGTFVGIMLGLYKLGNAETTMAQISLIDRILPSMSMAFLTSIVGMTCSLFYSYLEKARLGEASLNISAIDNNLSSIFPSEKNVIEYLENMEIILANLNQGLSKNLGASVAKSIGDNTRTLFSGFNKEVNNLGNDISSKLSVIFNEIFNKEFIDEFKNIQEGLGVINSSFSTTNRAINKLLKEIPKYSENFEKLNTLSLQIYETSEKAVKNYDSFLLEIRNMEQVMSGINNFKVDVLKTVDYYNGHVAESYDQIRKLSMEVYEKYENISQAMQNIVETGIKETNSLVEINKEAIQKNISNVKNTNTEIESSLSKMNKEVISTQNILKENIENIEKSLKKDLGNVQEVLSKSTKLMEENYDKLGKNQEQLINSTRKALVDYDSTISKLNKEMVDIILNIKDMEREE